MIRLWTNALFVVVATLIVTFSSVSHGSFSQSTDYQRIVALRFDADGSFHLNSSVSDALALANQKRDYSADIESHKQRFFRRGTTPTEIYANYFNAVIEATVYHTSEDILEFSVRPASARRIDDDGNEIQQYSFCAEFAGKTVHEITCPAIALLVSDFPTVIQRLNEVGIGVVTF